jgi:hypothetical protein
MGQAFSPLLCALFFLGLDLLTLKQILPDLLPFSQRCQLQVQKRVQGV